MPRRLAILLVVAVVVALSMGTAAYASGNVPYALVSENLQSPAWVEDHCSGDEIGRPSKCPEPGLGPVAELPREAPAGSMVSYGDSFSSGEGAPRSGQYRKVPRSQLLKTWSGVRNYCNFADPLSCVKPGKLQEEVWDGASGFFPGTDGSAGNTCHRSPEAYAPRMAAALELGLEFRACSGAVTKDFFIAKDDRRPAQRLGPVKPDTKLVTVGFGGNNVHFSDIVEGCIGSSRAAQSALKAAGLLPQWTAAIGAVEQQLGKRWKDTGSCAPFAEAMVERSGELLGTAEEQKDSPDSVRGVLRAVRKDAPPGARVIATSYPHMFPEDNKKACGLGSGEANMGPSEQRAINALVDAINDAVRVAAVQEGVDFVDMTYAFVQRGAKAGSLQDHGMCQDKGPDGDPNNPERWINRFRVTNAFTETLAYKGSVHPNAAGQAVYAERMLACYRDRTFCDGLLNDYDWKTPSLAAMNCLGLDDEDFNRTVVAPWEVTPSALEVTGDGGREVVVEAQCPTNTSSNPTQFIVFDVAGAQPRLIGVLGKEHYYRDATVKVEGTDVVVAGSTVGPDDPLCCADHVARDVYRWDGGKFQSVSSEENDPAAAPAPAAPPASVLRPPGDTVDALITSSADARRALPGSFASGIGDKPAVAYDAVQWFEGPDAAKACLEDGKSGAGAWCADYYWRNTNGQVRLSTVAPGAKLEILTETSAGWRTVGLAEFEQHAIASKTIFTLTFRGEEIISAKERFTP